MINAESGREGIRAVGIIECSYFFLGDVALVVFEVEEEAVSRTVWVWVFDGREVGTLLGILDGKPFEADFLSPMSVHSSMVWGSHPCATWWLNSFKAIKL